MSGDCTTHAEVKLSGLLRSLPCCLEWIVTLLLIVPAFSFVGKLILGLLLSMDMGEAHIVDSKFEVFTMLHDGHCVSHVGKRVRE